MRIIANENISRSVIRKLRENGHNVLSIKESLIGASDPAVLALAQSEKRIIITHDKDFGELAFCSNLPSDSGVILFRISGTSPDIDNQRIIVVLESRTDWEGLFSVVDDFRIRMGPLPVISH